jgi:UDP-N-acetylmuramate dehydrogenase
MDSLPRLTPALRGRLEFYADMGRFVSWRAGGKADRLYTPADLEDLSAFLQTVPPSEAILFIGLGSNLLIRDGGFRGTVIHLHGALRQLHIEQRRQRAWADLNADQFGVVYADAGVASPKLASFAAANNLVGAEFLAGIPGTVGGALAMNAGCYGSETWTYVLQVLTIDRQGELRRRRPDEFKIGYRQCLPGGRREEWFLGAWFAFPRGDGEASKANIKALLEKRIASQPLNLPNSGSVFRNPPGDHAARLIQACGLKGLTLGGAQVSEKHANFIVNLGGASAADIETLIDTVQAEVEAAHGIKLEREVRILGEHG